MIILKKRRNDEVTVREAARMCEIPKSTFFEKAKKYECAFVG